MPSQDAPSEQARRPDTPFWVERAQVDHDRLRLDAEESHHLLHVHRARVGAPFQAVDGEGSLYECVLESVERRSAVGKVLERRIGVGELRYPIHLLVGLPDWGAVELVTALAVPLGVSALDFVRCERSEGRSVGPKQLVRLGRIARAGLKQSRRTRLPEMRFSRSLEEALEVAPTGKRFAASPDGEIWDRTAVGSIEVAVVLSVGPPGGLTDIERSRLSKADFLSISLGPNRLSTETAALSLLCLSRNWLL